jgi:single-strand DNA-binding protein
MASYQSITIVGNSGSDPEMRYTAEGNCITSFTVAVDIGRYVNEQWKEETQWYRVSCFGKMAERVNERVSKGMPVMVVGTLRLNKWQDKSTGEMRSSLEIRANRVMNFGKAEQVISVKLGSSTRDEDIPDGDLVPDDIPF